jgi:hypothetical protein
MSSPVSIAIIKIKEDEFVFKAENVSKVDLKKLSIGFNVGFDWKLQEEHFFVTLTVFYKYKIDGVELELSRFITTTGYEVKGLKGILNVKEKGFELPDFFILTFVGTAVSSARGMLAYKLAGTILADFYLPLVDPQSFLNQAKGSKALITPKKSVPKKVIRKKSAVSK